MNSFPVVRVLTFRLRPSIISVGQGALSVKQPAIWRSYAGGKASQHDKLMEAQPGQVGPNMQQQEHVSEEAAKTIQIMGGQGPDLEQGTPVQDIFKEDKESQKQAPQVLKDHLKGNNASAKPSTGSRSFSTLSRSFAPETESAQTAIDRSQLNPAILPSASQRAVFSEQQLRSDQSSLQDEKRGHKFPLPSLPLPPHSNKDERYDPVVEQLTNLMMRHGEKATAQRRMAVILSHLRTAPAPTYSAQRPLLPGAPPASHLPLHPVLYLTLAIDSVAPLLRIRSQRGAAGGGVALQIPVPLGLRQRRRQAFMWILDAASKKPNRGSGKDGFALRVAEEIVAVVEGRSAVWEKRQAVHRLATTARANISFGTRRRM